MSTKDVAFKVEELQLRAEEINSLQSALYAALYEAERAKEDFEPAFVAFGSMTMRLQKDLNILKENLFEQLEGGRR